MSKRISAAIAGLLIIFSFSPDVRAQGTARLQVRVTVVSAVSAGVQQEASVSVDAPRDAQFSWAGKQQNHVITRTTKTDELDNTWLNSQNPCAPEGTKVLAEPLKHPFCEITINTVEFVPE